jgi:hypothetical protein
VRCWRETEQRDDDKIDALGRLERSSSAVLEPPSWPVRGNLPVLFVGGAGVLLEPCIDAKVG